ncbi:MAG: hypothetical protein ACRDQ5_14250 [Sciscionella sp.]
MLFLVLFLAVAAFGLLIASLAASMMVLAWASVGVSVLATLLLVFDSWLRSRSRRRARRTAAAPTPRIKHGLLGDGPDAAQETADASAGRPAQDDMDDMDAEGLAAPDEPAVEQTSEADLLIIAESHDEVVVIDERPRYHLGRCAWLAARPTLPLPVYEARELGFTPCARCSPDADLVARHRSQPAS